MSPTSPTYWLGDFGKVVRPYSSTLITTATQAATAALAELRKTIGLPHVVDITAVPNPALEPYDPLRIRFVGGSVIHAISTLSVPLTAGEAMSATTLDQTGINLEVGDE